MAWKGALPCSLVFAVGPCVRKAVRTEERGVEEHGQPHISFDPSMIWKIPKRYPANAGCFQAWQPCWVKSASRNMIGNWCCAKSLPLALAFTQMPPPDGAKSWEVVVSEKAFVEESYVSVSRNPLVIAKVKDRIRSSDALITSLCMIALQDDDFLPHRRDRVTKLAAFSAIGIQGREFVRVSDKHEAVADKILCHGVPQIDHSAIPVCYVGNINVMSLSADLTNKQWLSEAGSRSTVLGYVGPLIVCLVMPLVGFQICMADRYTQSGMSEKTACDGKVKV
ncbi:hypothetical protein QBC36DRAFT_373874 [Triangularia setosa]|uniref:Uncharacterized protein n=1 Tax=Triangularia setosa TaxID=2587417 RepID=A0AAN6WH35_9PEZI|nr:hypothetical protein QBC36DRAFT_373874 [Podospora setosa]